MNTMICRAMFILMLLISSATIADDAIVILPSKIQFTGPEFRQRLLVETIEDGQITGQVHDSYTLKSSNPGVVRIEEGFAVPAGNGKAVITATAGKQVATVEVMVENFEKPHLWSFRNHVQSILTKTGCNSGACHGAVAGKNGFKLSLRGYDPASDVYSITRQSRGRRVVPRDPGRSLLLTKPTGAVPHKGGLRFQTDSLEYRVVAEWLANGQQAPSDKDPRIERLEVLPERFLSKPGASQQLVVRAHFTDGHVEDVTRWAKYTSTNLSVASVNQQGEVAIAGSGEGAVMAWYLAQNAVATLTVPYANESVAERIAATERKNFIDDLVLEKLQSLNLPPSAPATDAEFLRRAYLDTTGVLPSVNEAREFLADTSPDKKSRLIDELLTRPEYADYWTYKWSDLMLVSGKRLRPEALKNYYDWIRQQVEANTPWDEFARQVVTAKGSTFENGAANFFALHQDPLDMAETVSMAFLGMSINCARCHDHPLEKWTNDDYYGMANLFSRVRGKGWGGDFRGGDGNRTIYVATDGELIQPRTGEPQLPRPLDGTSVPFDSEQDRRVHLADWLTSSENPYFSRAIVNRVWANFFGVGLVENIDDMRLTNPPSNPKLMQALAEFLVENDFNIKALAKLILNSATYQRSSQATVGNEGDTRFYSRYYPRRLKAEVLLDALSQATAVPTKFADHTAGTRALQLPDAAVDSYFLDTFGRPERIITCECERSDEPSMVQVLHIMNGSTLNDKLAEKENRLGGLLATNAPEYRMVEELYLAALSRFPTDHEMVRILAVLAEVPVEEKRTALEDVGWSLLSSKEFLFNH